MNKVFYAMVAMCAFALITHFTPQAKAEALATLPNNGGGKIVLTDEECIAHGVKYEPLRRAYSFVASGTIHEGCFYVDNTTESVVIVWTIGGKQNRYPKYDFKVIPKEKLIPS